MAKKIEFQFKKPEDSPGFLLAQVTMLWQRKQKRVLDPLNLTHTQFVLLSSLAWLSKERDFVTQVDIANLSNTDRMMVSKVLRTLEEKEFVTRHEHKTDTRAKIIRLTQEGAEVLQKALIMVESVDLDFFSPIETNLEVFNRYILKLIDANMTE
nr:MarR family transcriptional regulator [uncultured Draconibacterium sp.]